jgi:hypothetical protein
VKDVSNWFEAGHDPVWDHHHLRIAIADPRAKPRKNTTLASTTLLVADHTMAAPISPPTGNAMASRSQRLME